MTDLHLMLYGLRRRESMAIQSLRVLAELAERIRLDVLALAGLREQLPQGDLRTRTRELLEMAADAIADIADALRDETTPAQAFPILASFGQTRDAGVAGIHSPAIQRPSPSQPEARPSSSRPGDDGSQTPPPGPEAQEAFCRRWSCRAGAGPIAQPGGALRRDAQCRARRRPGEVRAIQADAELPTTLRTEGARATLRQFHVLLS